MLTETGKFVLLLFVKVVFFILLHFLGYTQSINLYNLCLLFFFFHSLGAVSGQTVAFGYRQNCVVATSAIGTHDRNVERLRLYRSTANALLLHSSPLQGVHGLTATFALTDRKTDRWKGTHNNRETERTGWWGTVLRFHSNLQVNPTGEKI